MVHPAHGGGDLALAGRLQAIDRARDVRLGAVLAELPLALDAVDDDLDADDRLELAGDVGLGRVVDRPGLLARTFVALAQRRTLTSTQAGSSWITSRP